jgi:hypothetical protein
MSGLLPFSADQFFAVFAAYNEAPSHRRERRFAAWCRAGPGLIAERIRGARQVRRSSPTGHLVAPPRSRPSRGVDPRQMRAFAFRAMDGTVTFFRALPSANPPACSGPRTSASAAGSHPTHPLIHISDTLGLSGEDDSLVLGVLGAFPMQIDQHSTAKFRISFSALITFLAITFLITWGLIGICVVAPGLVSATFGEISGSHPFFFLATWSPAIAAFVAVLLHSSTSGIRAFHSRACRTMIP